MPLPDNPTLWPAGALDVPLEQFLACVATVEFVSPPDDNLRDMVADLCADPIERSIIDELITEYRRDAGFTTPLRLEDGVLTNGYHRLAALVEIGVPVVQVWVVRDGVFEPGHETLAITATTFRLVPRPQQGINDLEDLITDALFAARSLASPDGWLEADGASSTHTDAGVLVTYDYYTTPARVHAALPQILARFTAHGIDATFVSATPQDI